MGILNWIDLFYELVSMELDGTEKPFARRLNVCMHHDRAGKDPDEAFDWIVGREWLDCYER